MIRLRSSRPHSASRSNASRAAATASLASWKTPCRPAKLGLATGAVRLTSASTWATTSRISASLICMVMDSCVRCQVSGVRCQVSGVRRGSASVRRVALVHAVGFHVDLIDQSDHQRVDRHGLGFGVSRALDPCAIST